MSYVTRFIVDPEVGPRGVELHGVRGDTAIISYFAPQAGAEYPLGAGIKAYREAQEKRHEVPAAGLFETLDEACDAAVEAKRRLAASAPVEPSAE